MPDSDTEARLMQLEARVLEQERRMDGAELRLSSLEEGGARLGRVLDELSSRVNRCTDAVTVVHGRLELVQLTADRILAEVARPKRNGGGT